MDGLIRAAGYLLGLDHSLGFIGPIGVGKTTGLCTLCNLVNDGDGNPLMNCCQLLAGKYRTGSARILLRVEASPFVSSR